VTIMRRGENSFGRFLEVAVYDVGGRKGLVLFPEGRDEWGWSRVSCKLSKVSAFFEEAGKMMGKASGSLLLAEVVCLAARVFVKGVGKQRSAAYVVLELVEARQAVAWGDSEKHFPVGMECLAVERQPVDCYASEKHSLYPLGNTPCAIDGSRSALACCNVSEGDGDLSKKEKASIFRNLLELFGEWFVWASRLLPRLGLKHFGLKHKASCLVVGWMFKRAKAVLRRAHFRVGSRCLGSKASSKTSDPASGLIGDLGLALFTRVGEGVPAASTFMTLAGSGSASGLTVSSALVLDLVVGSKMSSTVGLDLVVLLMRSDLGIGGLVPAASVSVRLVGGDPLLSSSSEATSKLLELGAVWKSTRVGQHDQFALPELAPSLVLVGFGPTFLDVPSNCSRCGCVR
jgi:hypothetical protein